MDYNATAPLRPEVREAMNVALARVGNPSSVHRFGREARQGVERARAAIAALVEADPRQVVFTSGGTEANAMAVNGTPRAVLASSVEHPSILAARTGVTHIPVDSKGIVMLDALAALLRSSSMPALVSVMAANNETGVIQPVPEIAATAHEFGAIYHCDAVQWVGRRPFNLRESGADMVTVSAHKLGGPQGIGALVIRDTLDVEPIILGGGQERGRRAGTENVAGIIGFGVAATVAQQQFGQWKIVEKLRAQLEDAIRSAAPDATIYGADSARIENTSCVGMPGVRADVQVMAMDISEIAVSAGAACSSGTVAPSHVLRAMGADDAKAGGAIRFSLGWTTTESDIDRAVAAWLALYRRTRARHGQSAA